MVNINPEGRLCATATVPPCHNMAFLTMARLQTGASGLTRPPFIHAVEAFEQSGQMLVVHAHAVVCYGEYCIVLGAFQTNIYDGPHCKLWHCLLGCASLR